MSDFRLNDYKVFDMFQNQWGIVTAGTMEEYNGCTVSWGSLGTIWTRPGKSGSSVTVYLHPARYTNELLKRHDIFTVSFLPKEYRKALGYMGSHSGRHEDKVAAAGLTPVSFGKGVTYEEAELTFLCRKVYGHQLSKDDLAPDIQAYYKENPIPYPVDENGEWQPHWLYIGEVVDVLYEELLYK